MVIVFLEGFEKHAPTLDVSNQFYAGSTAFDLAGQSFLKDWLSITPGGNGINVLFTTGRGGQGKCVFFSQVVAGGGSFKRNVPTLSRGIVGFAFNSSLVASVGVNLLDSGTAQLSVYVDNAGKLNVARASSSGAGGTGGGTILFTAATGVAADTWHYVELDATIHNTAGAYQLWLDGASLTSASSQNTRASANNSFNQLEVGVASSGSAYFDDMYLFDATGSFNNAARGDSAVVTLRPTADDTVQFSPGSYAIGPYARQTNGTNAPGANTLCLVPCTPEVNCTLSAIHVNPQATSAGAKLKGVVYSDNTGNPGSLLSDGTEVVGVTSGVNADLPLVTPQALTGGTQYWIGYYSDTSLTVADAEIVANLGQKKAATYTSGAPAGPLSGMTTGQPTWQFWGTASAAASNFALVDQSPGALVNGVTADYASAGISGYEDLYVLGNFPATPSTIGGVQLSALLSKDVAGGHTADLRLKSGSTDSAGTNAGVALGTTPAQVATTYDVDPDTSAAWTSTGVNGAKVGVRVAS